MLGVTASAGPPEVEPDPDLARRPPPVSRVYQQLRVVTTDATVGDPVVVDEIHDRLDAKGLLPGEHLMDAGYISAELLLTAPSQRGVRVIGPVRPMTRRTVQATGYDKASFTIDWDAHRAICPDGSHSRYWTRGPRQQPATRDPHPLHHRDLRALPLPRTVHQLDTLRSAAHRPPARSRRRSRTRPRRAVHRGMEGASPTLTRHRAMYAASVSIGACPTSPKPPPETHSDACANGCCSRVGNSPTKATVQAQPSANWASDSKTQREATRSTCSGTTRPRPCSSASTPPAGRFPTSSRSTTGLKRTGTRKSNTLGLEGPSRPCGLEATGVPGHPVCAEQRHRLATPATGTRLRVGPSCRSPSSGDSAAGGGIIAHTPGRPDQRRDAPVAAASGDGHRSAKRY